jgi:hypothetical protein
MHLTDLKKNKVNVFCAWILLLCFVAGQYMVGIHQHNALLKSQVTYSQSKHLPGAVHTIQEKCYFCDAMHHNAMDIAHQTYFCPAVVTGHVYKAGDYNFVSIALILSAGRAPPVTALS